MHGVSGEVCWGVGEVRVAVGRGKGVVVGGVGKCVVR